MTDKKMARKRAILIMAAGTAADTLRLPTGERIGGLWTFESREREAVRMSQISEVLAAHGLDIQSVPPSAAASGLYGIQRQLDIIPLK